MGLYVPALILAFSGVDALAALSYGRNTQTRKRFISWIDRYFLPNSPLQIDSRELYAARCAIIHTFGPNSSLSDKGDTRRVLFGFQEGNTETLRQLIATNGDESADIVIDFTLFIESFEMAINRFIENINSDTDLSSRVQNNSHQLFAAALYGPAFSVLDIKLS